MNTLLDQELSVIEINSINSEHFLLKIGPLLPHFSFNPGQFVMIKAEKNGTLLRKPFGIVEVEDHTLTLLIKIVGKTTKNLSTLKKGDKIQVLGPLGTGFTELQDHNIVIAGGIGIAPLYSLLKEYNPSSKNQTLTVLYGGKSYDHLPLLEKVYSLHINCSIATEDGSVGHEGFITDLLGERIVDVKGKKTKLFSCGPRSMLKAVALFAQKNNCSSELSLEEYMACGTGICMGCTIKVKEASSTDSFTYKRVCVEGPVFNGGDIEWE
ncbi:dihydroorotate dehydrogenase electron transfer subunit [Chlamydiota bacterium]